MGNENEPSGSVASEIAQMNYDLDQEIEDHLDNTRIPNERILSSPRTTSEKRKNSPN